MSVLFESPDYSQDFCEGCMMVVPGEHVCTRVRQRIAAKRYRARNGMPEPQMVVGPVEGFADADDATDTEDVLDLTFFGEGELSL